MAGIPNNASDPLNQPPMASTMAKIKTIATANIIFLLGFLCRNNENVYDCGYA